MRGRDWIAAGLAGLLTVSMSHAETRVPASAAEITLSFAPVVRAAVPAVVNIYARRTVAGRAGPFADDPFFGQFFRDFGPVVPREQNALGSGVILGADGLVVSNTHVVGGAQEIRVVLADRREFDAELILADEESDLAVLRLIGAADLPVLEPRGSDSLEVGELVLAIGNPFGVGQTVSLGIVSGLARSLRDPGGGRGYFIQTDAAINPGNSGGALVDTAGRLVGINTAIFTRSGGSQGVGFAIPADLVAQVVAQAAAGADRFVRPWAGAAGQGVDPALAEALGLAQPQGVLLTELHPQSPLAGAGLRPGDLVIALDGAPVDSPQEMFFRLSAAGPGAEIGVEWLRNGQAERAVVKLITAPDDPPRARLVLPEGTALQGLTVETINPAVIGERGLPLSATGVVVAAAQGWAARIGLRSGDVLVAVNGTAVVSSDALAPLVAPRAGDWQIDILRGGRPATLRFRL